VAGLSGTGRLADDLYLVAHHEQTGKPHLQPRALGLGLAGTLLAELMLSRSIRLWRGVITAADGILPGDDLARSVLGQVASEREHLPPRDWLLYLARTAAGDVARQLEQSGYLTRVSTWRFSRGERWVPLDADCAFAPLVRVKSALAPSGPVAAQNAALGGLAAACGLGHQLALYLPPHAHRRLEEAAGQLDPGLRELIAQTQAAVDSALLAHRV
jgi:Golgi phosphoprotein 3 (GPP34)